MATAKKAKAAKKATARKSASKRTGGRRDTMSREVVCRTFAAAYLRFGNSVRAFREAVPNSQANQNTASKEAFGLLHDPRTQAWIEKFRAAACERAEATLAEWIANELRLARSDPARLFDDDGTLLPISEIDPDTRHAIQSMDVEEERIDVTENGDTVTTVRSRVKKIKLHSKDGAQDRLAKYVGAYQRDNEQQNIVTQLLAKVPAANLATLEDLLRGCGADASNGGEASAGSSPAATGGSQ